MDVQSEATAILYLLAIYFVYDVKYPTLYGLFYIRDTFCIRTKKKARIPDTELLGRFSEGLY